MLDCSVRLDAPSSDFIYAKAVLAEQRMGRGAYQPHAVSVGLKSVSAVETDVLCVQVHVRRKLPESGLSQRERIPTYIDGIPIDIRVSPLAIEYAGKRGTRPTHRRHSGGLGRARYRPILGGVSCAHRGVALGTLAAVCRSTRASERHGLFLLSNRHTFAPPGAQRGDDVYQAAPGDGGTDLDAVATLARTTPRPVHGHPAIADAAIARINASTKVSCEIVKIGTLSRVAEPESGMIVCKHGRSTGYTLGKIVSCSYDAIVSHDNRRTDAVTKYRDQIRIEPVAPDPAFARPGDSGALIVERTTNRAIGLHFAGGADGSYALANRLTHVERALEIELLTSNDEGSD